MSPVTWTARMAKRVVVAVVGMTVLLVGVAMIVLPGPAFIVIPLGLGVLATEFVWAKRLLRRAGVEFNRLRGRPAAPAEAEPAAPAPRAVPRADAPAE